MMKKEKGFAYCGLACCLCSKKDCPGCRADGCPGRQRCQIPDCCKEKGIFGCYACEKRLICENPMLRKPKIMAFNRCLTEYGETTLAGLLERNEKAGVVYHKNDKITGDYDLENISDILRLIREGKRS